MAMLALHVGNVNLMKNQDIWSKTIRDTVLVSAYPLAMWFASSWWRLNWEPLPAHSIQPSLEWRMAHELAAAGHGFVWPKIIFASDREVMQIWAVSLGVDENQSVNYLNGLEIPASVTLGNFRNCVEDFIKSVIERLSALENTKTDLPELWKIIQEENSEPETAKYRRLEAEMGFEPDECPGELMKKALELDQKIGTSTLSELAPIYGKSAPQKSLAAIEEIAESPGLIGVPEIPMYPSYESSLRQGAPWERAVAVARELRRGLPNPKGVLANAQLSELLGLDEDGVSEWSPAMRNAATIALPRQRNEFKFIPRKTHPIGKRFELARIIGDYILTEGSKGQWLTSTDLGTSRQKFQRAFAAEFLCPIDSLREYLQNDFSEPAVEDAAHEFQVSQRTIESLLANNGLLSMPCAIGYTEGRLPYQVSV